MFNKSVKIISLFMAAITLITACPQLVLAASAIISVPPVENGTFTVTRTNDNTLLKNGDTVSSGDTLIFKAIAAEGYKKYSYLEDKTVTLTDEDFILDITDRLPVVSPWSVITEDKSYEGIKNTGITVPISKGDRNEKTITYTLNVPADLKTAIDFEWAINQGFTGYGTFKLQFYHNNTLIKEDTLNDSNVNGYKQIRNVSYEFTTNGNDEFKWVFVRLTAGSWADEGGRAAYLGNIKIKNIYEVDAPIFKKLNPINTTQAENGSISVTNEACEGDIITVDAIPEQGCSAIGLAIKTSDGISVACQRTEENKYTFVMPDSGVTITPYFNNSTEAVYNIYTLNDLLTFIDIAQSTSAVNAVLCEDIDANGAALQPICSSSELIYKGTNITQLGYQGEFDGKNHKISNFTIATNSAELTAGLFGTVSGTVKNIIIENASFNNNGSYDGRFAALCGQLLTNGLIENAVVYNSNINANGKIAGAVVGANYGGTIKNSVSLNNTVNAHNRVGNLVGDNENDDKTLKGTLTNCYSDKKLSGTQAGIVSNCQANISNIKEIAHKLNTNNLTEKNTSAWGVNEKYPVAASELNPAVYQVTQTYDEEQLTDYAFSGDVITIPDKHYHLVTVNEESVLVDASGNYVFTVGNEDLHIKAMHTKCNVTFNENGGTIYDNKPSYYYESIGLDLPTDVRKNGFIFNGWYESPDFAGKPAKSITTKDTGDKVYYAKFVSPIDGYEKIIADPLNSLVSINNKWRLIDKDNTSYLEASEVGDNSQAELTINLDLVNSVYFTYDYYVSSEQDYDVLEIYIDGENIAQHSGLESGTKAFEVSSGQHTVSFVYSKDFAYADNEDLARISNIKISSLGDVNCDSYVNQADAEALLKYLGGIYTTSDINVGAADADKNSSVNMGDVITLITLQV